MPWERAQQDNKQWGNPTENVQIYRLPIKTVKCSVTEEGHYLPHRIGRQHPLCTCKKQVDRNLSQNISSYCSITRGFMLISAAFKYIYDDSIILTLPVINTICFSSTWKINVRLSLDLFWVLWETSAHSLFFLCSASAFLHNQHVSTSSRSLNLWGDC